MTPIMVHVTMIGVGHDVPLAAVELLACVVAAGVGLDSVGPL